MNTNYKDIQIDYEASILSALKQMDTVCHKLLIVTKDEKFYRLLSIGDIQRAIIKNSSLDLPIKNILRNVTTAVSIHEDIDAVKASMLERKNEFMPIVDDDNNIVDIIFWEDLFDPKEREEYQQLGLPVIIMAGGQGTRLRPLTNVIPKPLIPIGEQTMIEDIMDRFLECGCKQFYISVNYKADIIKWYLENDSSKKYDVTYFQEDKPLGTAGSLHLLKDKIKSTFFVSNCDMLIDENYGKILNYHRENNNEITVVAAIKDINIPYGTLKTKNDGLLDSLQEKPDLTFKINTGMYILEPHLINEIPSDRIYHITYLIEKLVNENRRVGVYPISEGSWIDVGNWNEYIHQFM